jgi:hypothetical protein
MHDAQKKKQDDERIASLNSQILAETDVTKKAELEKELADYQEGIRQDAQERAINDQIDGIRDQEDLARKNSQDAKDLAKSDYDYKKSLEDQSWENFQTNQQNLKDALDTGLQEQLDRYDADEKSFETMCSNKLLVAADFVRTYSQLMAGLTSALFPVTPTLPVAPSGSTTPPATIPSIPSVPADWDTTVPGWADGGMIMEPSLITSLRTLKPIAIAGEAGPEPVGGMRGVLITGNTFNVRDDSDIDRIGDALIHKMQLRTGWKR